MNTQKKVIDIGIEIHINVNSHTKLFSSAPNKACSTPNLNVSPIDIGVSGARGVLNQAVVTKAIRLAVATNCWLEPISTFTRKHYVYPDLPSGFQLTQFYKPFARDGVIILPSGHQVVINEMHIEADAGKLANSEEGVVINYNRVGCPLIEIVTGICFHSSNEVIEFLEYFKRLVKYIDVSNANAEEGDIRVDVNISCRNSISDPYGVRGEIKNLNSFSAIKKAIDYIQDTAFTETLPQQSTLQYNVKDNSMMVLRKKQSANEYNQIIENSLAPLFITKYDIEKCKSSMPILPHVMYVEYISKGIHSEIANNLIDTMSLNSFYQSLKHQNVYAANVVSSLLSTYIQENAHNLHLLKNIVDELSQHVPNNISANNANKVVKEMMAYDLQSYNLSEHIAEYIIERDINKLKDILNEVIVDYPSEWNSYCNGNDKLYNRFLGYMRNKCKNIDVSLAQTLIKNKNMV